MLPDLPTPYDEALREAIDTILGRFAPEAIIASGTIVRGNPDPSSDLDIVVVHGQDWRQRVQCLFHGIPTELFVNPASQIRRAFVTEARQARPVLAHMLATGIAVLDGTGIAAELQTEAAASLASGPQVDAGWLELRRYGIATTFEDACDLVTSDPARSRSLAHQAMCETVDWWFPAHGLWRPRAKVLFVEFERQQPALGGLVRTAIITPDLDDCLAQTASVLTATIGATGFFPWESTPEPV